LTSLVPTRSEWHRAVRAAVAQELCALDGSWTDDGRRVQGPGALGVYVDHRHGDDRPGAHVDVGFALAADEPVLWDCVAPPPGHSLDEAARYVARVWSRTVAPVGLELATRTGRFADHAHGDDGLGLDGWHSIHGAIIAAGSGDIEGSSAGCSSIPSSPRSARSSLPRSPRAASAR
jgi:hypothetical protein